jgi:PAS domain S-box-containing protein
MKTGAGESGHESWLRAIVDQHTDGIVAFEANGSIHYANTTALSMLGFDSRDEMPTNVFDLTLSEPQQNRLREFIEHSPTHKMRESLNRHRNEVLIRRDGTTITSSVTMSYVPIKEQDFFILTLGELSWRRQVEQQMFMSDAIRSGILESSISAIVAIDQNDRVLEFNPSAEKMFGYRRDEIIGEKMADMIMPERFREAHRMGMRRFLESGEGPVLRQRIEISAIDREHREFPIEVAITPIKTSDGNVFTAVIDDISQRKKDNEKLRLATESAVRANDEKSRFLASMSHEIRTPLNILLGMIDLIQGTDVTKQQKEFLVNAENAGRSLLDMINDVLDLSKIEAGKMEPKNAPFDPVEIFEQTVALFKQRCWSKNLRLHAFIGNELPEAVISDLSFYRQILSNFLANAVNYTEQGHVIAKLFTSRINGLMHLKLEVTDTGVGLSPEAQKQLFQEFTQVHESTPKGTKGTGLGLVICRQLANLIGGDVTVRSEDGKGSTFSFELPLPTESLQSSSQTLQGQSCVVWSEDPTLSQVLDQQLAAWGCCVERVSQSLDSKHIAHSNAILVDTHSLSLKALNAGIQKLEQADSRAKLFCLVESKRIAMDCRKFEPTFVQWPLQTQLLVAALKGGFDSETNQGIVSHPSAKMGNGKEHYSSLNNLKVLLVDDSPANLLITATYLESAGCKVFEAVDGLDAVSKVEQTTFDAILMDMRMPNMGGVEATEKIRSLELAEGTPIIALTAHAMADVRDQCLAVGMQDFLTKPIEKDLLYETLLRCTNSPKEAKFSSFADHEYGSASLNDEADLPLFSPAAIDKLIGETSQKAVAKMLNVFFAETKRRSELIERAIQDKSVEDLEVSVHALKSSSITFGAERLSQSCKAAEDECREGSSDKAFYYSEMVLPLIEATRQQLVTDLASWWSPDGT